MTLSPTALAHDDAHKKDYLSHIQEPQYQNIPLQLRTGKRHLVWIPEERGNTIAKTPYNARALVQSEKYCKASSTNERSWSSFPQAVKACQEHSNVGGIGRVLADGIMQIDLDHCIRHDTKEVHPAALEILGMFDTNHETSPGDGVHIFPLAHVPEGAKHAYFYKGIKVELYDSGRYTTLTGIPVPGVPPIPELKDQQAQVNALVKRLSAWEQENTSVLCCVCDLARDGAQHGGQGEHHCTCQLPSRTVAQQPEARATKGHENVLRIERQAPVAPAIREADLLQGDLLVLDKARAAKNSETFWARWNGGDPHQRHDTSRADFDLILLLLYWTGDSASNDCSAQVERLFLASGRNRPELYKISTVKGRYTKLQVSIYNARCKKYGVILPERGSDPEPPSPAPGPGGPTPESERQAEKHQRKSGYQVIRYVYEWMSDDFDQVQRNAELSASVQGIKDRTVEHLKASDTAVYVAAAAPGLGKSYAYAEICDLLDTAVIVPRHELADGVPGYKKQRRIRTANQQTCPDHEKHHRIGSMGYNTRPVHKAHSEPCAHILQYEEQGSAG